MHKENEPGQGVALESSGKVKVELKDDLMSPEDITLQGSTPCSVIQICPEGYYFCKRYCGCILENPDCVSKLKCGPDQYLDKRTCTCIPK